MNVLIDVAHEFQFQLGAIKGANKITWRDYHIQFQFQLGAIKGGGVVGTDSGEA